MKHNATYIFPISLTMYHSSFSFFIVKNYKLVLVMLLDCSTLCDLCICVFSERVFLYVVLLFIYVSSGVVNTHPAEYAFFHYG